MNPIKIPTMDFPAQNPPPSPPSSTAAKSPVLPWKTRLLISLTSLLFDLTARSDGTVNRRFRRLFELTIAANPVKPIDGVISFDVAVDPTRNLSVRVFTPVAAVADSLPIIIFFHGGGFAFYSNDSYGYVIFCRRLARHIPAVILSVEYRLAPEYRFPSQYDDGFDILRFLDDNNTLALQLPATAHLSHCFLAGDSSGANLAHHVAVRYSRQKSQFQRLKIIGLLSIQPFFGGIDRTESEIGLNPSLVISLPVTDWMWKAFLPEGSDRNHYAANVTAAEMSKLEDFPATIVVIGGFDLLKDRQRKYYECLKECGMKVDLIEFPNMIHTFYLHPNMPQSSFMIHQLKEFIFKCRDM